MSDEIKKSLQGLTAGTRYSVRARSINEFGLFSEWSDAVDFTTEDDSSVPESVAALVVDFNTPTLLASWGASSTNTDGSALLDLRGYRVTLTAGAVSMTYDTSQPFFVYPFEQNHTDFGTAQPIITVKVQAVDVAGHLSSAIQTLATNPAPPTPTDPPDLVSGFTMINISIPAQVGVNDLDGFTIYHSTNPTDSFTELVTTTNGASNYSHAVDQGSTHYYKYKTRDVFGQLSPDFSPTASETTFATGEGDTTAPDSITDFHVTSQGINPDQLAYINLGWDPSPATDLGSYEIRYRRQGDVSFASAVVGRDVVSYHFEGLTPDATYEFQIRGADVSGNIGAWAPIGLLTVDTDADVTAPATPAGVTITPGFRDLILNWTPNTENDFDHYEIHVSNTNGFLPSAANLYSSPGPGDVETIARYYDGAAWQALVPGSTYYARMAAVDRTGNTSALSTQVSGTTRYVTNAEVAADSILADKITTSTLNATLTTSGAIRTASGGARMEMNSSGLVGYANDGTTENIRYKNADAGVVVDHSGYIKSSNYVPGTSGWYLGAGSGTGLLEVNEGLVRANAIQIGISTENLLKNSSFENIPDIGPHIGLADFWGEYPTNATSSLTHTYSRGTGPNALYQSSSQTLTTVGTPSAVGVMQSLDLSVTPITASPSNPNFVTVSYWIKMASTAGGNRLARVSFKDVTAGLTYTIPVAVTLTNTAWTRVVNTVTLTSNVLNAEIHCFVQSGAGNLNAGEVFYFEGAQLELASHVSSYHPAMLEIPDNYIQSAYISTLSADKLTTGDLDTAQINVKDIGFIQSFNYNTVSGLASGYRLTSSKLTFQNGGIEILKQGAFGGPSGGISLEADKLKVVYGTTTRFQVDNTGVYIGGDTASNADVWFDTVNDVTKFHSAGGSYTFEINSNPSSGPSIGKVLRLYDPTGTVPDAFYLTYDGLGYFAKGVIGGDTGTSSNRLKNSSFESAQGISSTNAGNIDYWARVTGDSLSTITQDATDFMHGGSSLKIVWTTAGTRGIEASPWVGGLANSTWPATSTWMFSFYCKQTSATTGVPAVSFSGSGITATLIPPPTAAVQNAWQRWVFKIVTTSQVTSSIRITFAHANGTAYIDGAQLERGEVTTAYGPMPEEVPPVFLASADNLQSSNFTSTAGWQIKGDGTATFNSVTVRGRIDAPGYSTNLIQLGKDVGPVAGHMGLSLSQSDFNNIFLQRASDGLVFFRVNAGGAGGAMTFEPSGINNGTLTVTGTITANTLNATSGGTIGNFTISGSSLSGGTITSGSLTSSTVTGGTIRTAASGRRAELSSGFFQGVAFYSGDGNEANHGGVETFVSGGNRLVLTGYCPAWSLYSPPSFFMESGPGATQGASFYISGANYVGLSGLAQFTWLSPWNEWKVFSLPDIGGAILQRAAASSQIGPAPSTARLKKNIRALPESGHANPVWNMKARRFHWDEEKTGNGKHLNTIHTNGTAGLIAEELSEIAADCVYPDEEGLPHAINIFALFGYMVDGMQHMKEEIEILKAELKKRK